MISWDELGDFVEKVTGKRSHKGDALPKALFSWDELADFVERVTGKRPHCGDALPKALSGLPEAYDQLQAENKRLRLAHEEITDLPNRTGGWIYAADISRAALESNDE